jgi:hypothetical protein
MSHQSRDALVESPLIEGATSQQLRDPPSQFVILISMNNNSRRQDCLTPICSRKKISTRRRDERLLSTYIET